MRASCGVEVRADVMGADGSCRRSPLIAAAAAAATTALRYGSQRARDSIWQLLFGQAAHPSPRSSTLYFTWLPSTAAATAALLP